MTNLMLSPRQWDVARLVADDLTDKEIADILVVHIRTVQAHLDQIVRRLGLKDPQRSRRRQIARWVQSHELPPDHSTANVA